MSHVQLPVQSAPGANVFPTTVPMHLAPTVPQERGRSKMRRRGCQWKSMGGGRGRRCFCGGKMVRSSRCR